MLPFHAAQRAYRFDSASSGPVDRKIILTGRGTLVSLQGHNPGAECFVQLFDHAGAPASGAVPVAVVTVPAGEEFFIDVPVTGIPFTAGIVAMVSTTAATYTALESGGVLLWGVLIGESGV